MSSAVAKLRMIVPPQMGLGPHATRLLQELQGAARAELWASVIILSATLVDVMRHEDQIFDFTDNEEEEEYLSDGFDYLPAADRKKLDWLRLKRNQLIHYEGPVEGMMGRTTDAGQLSQDADRAVAALFIMLDDA